MKTGEDKMKKATSPNNVSKVVGTLVAGAAVGLAAGILLAPDKGKKTRGKLMDDAKDLTNKLKEKTNGFREKASEKIEEKTNEFKEKANEFKEKAGDRIEEKANELKDKANDIKEKTSDGMDAIANKE